MARFDFMPPETPVPRPVEDVPGEADVLPSEARVPDLGFTPPDGAPGDLPMIPFENFVGLLPDDAADEAADALEDMWVF